MITTADFRSGLNIEVERDIYSIVWFQHHKPGKGGAVMRVKMRNIRSGSIIERTFKSGEKFRDVTLEKRRKQYLYNDGQNYYFMDMGTYDQISLSKERLGKSADFLNANMEVEGLYLEEDLLGLELPANVELKVVSTVPGIRGDSVSNIMKPATLETGVEIQVPLFVGENDIVKVDTRTGEYIERVKGKD